MGINLNKVEVKNTGFYNVTFADGQILRFNWPDVKIHGIITKDPHYIFVDQIKVTDNKNGYVGTATFIPTKGKGFMGGLFGKKKEPQVTNIVRLKITQSVSEKEDVVLAKGK